MKGNKLTSLILVAVLTFSMIGVISLTTVPVSAECVRTYSKTVALTPSGGIGGDVGETMTFTVTVTDVSNEHWEGPTPVGVSVACGFSTSTFARGASGTFSFSGPGGSESASFVTDSSGKATVTHTFSQAGTYTVGAYVEGYWSTPVTVTIDGAPTAPAPTAAAPTSNANPSNGGATSSPQVNSNPISALTESPARVPWGLVLIVLVVLLLIGVVVLAIVRRK